MFQYRILRTEERSANDWNYTELVQRVEISYDGQDYIRSLSSLVEKIEDVLFEVIAYQAPEVGSEDRVRLAIRNHNLSHDIWISFRKGSQFTRNVISNAIFKVCQSKLEFLIEGILDVEIIVIKMPSGGGHKRKYGVSDLATYERISPKAIQIEKDGMCCSRSLVVGKAIADKVSGIEWRRLRDDLLKIQTDQAKELCIKASIQPFTSCGINELSKFQAVLSQYRIVVTSAQTQRVIFKGPDQEKSIYLIYGDDHYFPVRSLKAFLGYEFFCEACLVGFREKGSHKCDQTCKHCFGNPKCALVELIYCNECCREFLSNECFKNHKLRHVCNSVKACSKCCKVFQNRRKHICGKFYCSTCKKFVESRNHFCYIAAPNLETIKKEDRALKVFVFYDIETFISEKHDIHHSNLICVQHCCDKCSESDVSQGCSVCKTSLHAFKGTSSVENFCKWLFLTLRKDILKSSKGYGSPKLYVIAHNGRAFDFHFVLNYLNEHHIAGTPNIIKSGSKILSMTYCNVKFIDSLSFLPMPLKALPKAFGLKCSKGWFPHRFNKPENWNYVGCYPDSSYYEPESMLTHERKEFHTWYAQKNEEIFDFEKEILQYCLQDVVVLKQAFLTFRRSFINEYGIDPITRCITIAQACMEVYKALYLTNETIAVIPSFGYDPRRNSSLVANIWLDYISKSRGKNILKEKKIGKYYVDGYFETNKEVYEFFGCFFHGCIRCYPHERHFINNSWQTRTMDHLYRATQDKIENLKKSGYRVEYIWECDFKRLLQSSKDLGDFYSQFLKDRKKIKPPLDPRNAFFGGRTNAIKLFYEVKSNEKVRYYDFTSLYPFVVKYCSYPKGHPVIIRYNINDISTDISSYFGFILCEVLPPEQLFMPVLPMRINGKLIFTLCVKCAELQNQESCQHGDQERTMIGTWTSIELARALEKNYKIIKIFEVWHFEEIISYNKSTKTGGLFSAFMDKCLKTKVEASGWPDDVIDDRQKSAYIQSYWDREGIKLDWQKIEKNPPLRTQAKLMANSFWGKFAQKPNLSQICYINEPHLFFEMLADPKIIILDAYLVNNTTMLVQYEKRDGFINDPKHSNIVIAAFTTAYARLKLYDILDSIGEKVLYFDTDSVIFIDDESIKSPALGDFLGDLTDELKDYGEGVYISKFISGGPKNYAYEVSDNSGNIKAYDCKIKGITLNFRTKQKLSFDILEQLIKNSIITGDREKIFVDQLVFSASRENEIRTDLKSKAYRFVYDKRRIIPSTYSTLPFGYKD